MGLATYSFLHLAVWEWLIFFGLWLLLYLNFKPWFSGNMPFVFSASLIVMLVFVQNITERSLIQLFIAWFDGLHFTLKWVPVFLWIFFFFLLYEKEKGLQSAQKAGLLPLLYLLIVLFVFQ